MSTAEHVYRLCSYCAQRQGAGALDVVEGSDCFVCQGLMNKVPLIAEAAVRKIKRYQFGTFTVGVSVQGGIQEREDELRSDLKLMGNETIKTQMARLVATQICSKLHKRIDRLRPDLTLLASPETAEFSVSSKSVYFYGRYTKPRGASQKRESCLRCGGDGCSRCRMSGFEGKPSVEGLLRKRLFDFSGSDRMTFTWLGSEDRESKVLPPGRPFVVEVKNPIMRIFPKKFAARYRGGQVAVSAGRVLPAKPGRLPTFKFRTEILATAVSKVSVEALKGFRSAFKMREVRFDRPYDRPVFKTVYRAEARITGRSLLVSAELDGGLPVKRFVSGELVSPSVSEVLKTEVKCRRFDICGVTETGKFEIGEISRV